MVCFDQAILICLPSFHQPESNLVDGSKIIMSTLVHADDKETAAVATMTMVICVATGPLPDQLFKASGQLKLRQQQQQLHQHQTVQQHQLAGVMVLTISSTMGPFFSTNCLAKATPCFTAKESMPSIHMPGT